MKLRQILVTSCIAAICAVLLFRLPRWSTVFGQAGLEVTALNPAGSFDIATDPSLSLLAVDSGGGLLWLLFGAYPSLELIKMDSAGTVQGTSTLQAANATAVYRFCASPDGRSGAIHQDGQLEIYSQYGVVTNTMQAGSGLASCVFVDQTPFAFSMGDNAIRKFGGAQQTNIASPRVHLFGAVPLNLGDHLLGIVDQVEATLDTLDTDAGVWQSQQLQAPEIQQMPRTQPSEHTAAAALSSIASDPSTGDIFASVSSFNVNQGIMVLRFNRQGVLLSRLRCVPPPKSPALAKGVNRDGHFSPSDITVLGSRLFLFSRSQNRAVYYALN